MKDGRPDGLPALLLYLSLRGVFGDAARRLAGMMAELNDRPCYWRRAAALSVCCRIAAFHDR